MNIIVIFAPFIHAFFSRFGAKVVEGEENKTEPDIRWNVTPPMLDHLSRAMYGDQDISSGQVPF